MIHEGQFFKVIVKKVTKSSLLLLKKESSLLPLFIKDGFTLILNRSGVDKTQEIVGMGQITELHEKKDSSGLYAQDSDDQFEEEIDEPR